MLADKQGYVSIWAGRVAKKSELTAYLKESGASDDQPISRFAVDCRETFYDHDKLESGHAAKDLPVPELLDKYSYADSFAAAAGQLATKGGLSTANAVILAYDLVLEPNRWPKDAPLMHLGALPYSKIATPKYQPLEKVRGHKHRVMRIAFAPGGPLAATGDDSGTLLAWDSTTGFAVSQVQPAFETGVNWLAFSAAGQRLVGGAIGATRVWTDFPAAKRIGPLVEISAKAISSDGRLVFRGRSDRVQVFDLDTGQELPALPLAASQLCGLPDDKLAAIGDAGLVSIWDRSAKKQLVQSQSPLEEFDEFQSAVGGKFVVMYYDDQLAGFDIQRNRWWTGQAQNGIRDGDLGSGNKGLLAAGPLELWDWTTGKRVKAFGTRGMEYSKVSLSPDEKLALAVASDSKSAELWDAAGGTRLAVIPAQSLGKSEELQVGCIAPDNETIALGAFSGRVLFFHWDGKKLTPVRPL